MSRRRARWTMQHTVGESTSGRMFYDLPADRAELPEMGATIWDQLAEESRRAERAARERLSRECGRTRPDGEAMPGRG